MNDRFDIALLVEPRHECKVFQGVTFELTNGGTIAIRQQFPIPIVVGGTTSDYGSSVAVTYNRSFLFNGGSLFRFNSVSLNGNAVFHNLY